MSFHVPEICRVLDGPRGSDTSAGNNGMFLLARLPLIHRHVPDLDLKGLRVIASDGGGWEHVSISRVDRCPTWVEMHTAKLIFWDETDAVMQLHPPSNLYVNDHPFCLHLWRPVDQPIPLPPIIYV